MYYEATVGKHYLRVPCPYTDFYKSSILRGENKLFGYVRILDGELKVSEYKLYKGVYCALCKTMKRYAGASSTLSLSYDLVFLALLRAETDEAGFKIRLGRCGLHPFKKRPLAEENSALRFSAGASVVLTYYKLLDDLNDKNTGKRLLKKIALGKTKKQLKRVYKKLAEYNFPELSEKIKTYLDELSALENARSDSPDACAAVFGKILSLLFSHGIEDGKKAEMTSALGYSVGRLIYLVDAMDDFYDDLKTGAFNPLISAGFASVPEDFLLASMYSETESAVKALKSYGLKYRDIGNILFNILSLGIPNVVNEILKKQNSGVSEENTESNAG